MSEWIVAQVLPPLPSGPNATTVAWMAAGFILALILVVLTIFLAFRRGERSLVALVKGLIAETNNSIVKEMSALGLTIGEMRKDIGAVLLRTERHDGKLDSLERQMAEIRARVEGDVQRIKETLAEDRGRRGK